MIRINLLPYRYIRRKREIRRFFLYLILSLFVLNVFSFVFFVKEKDSLLTSRIELKRAERRVKTLRAVKRAVETLKRERTDIKKRIALLRKLRDESLSSPYIMYIIAKSVPKRDVWISSIKRTGTSLEIEGNCRELFSLSYFMRRLMNQDIINSVFLRSIEKGKKTGIYSFKLKVGVGS